MATEAERRIIAQVSPYYDALLILRYRATNSASFQFQWVDQKTTRLNYGAILTRVSLEYDRRFGRST